MQNYKLLEDGHPKRDILYYIKKTASFIGKAMISIVYYPIVVSGAIFVSIITLAYITPILLSVAGMLFLIESFDLVINSSSRRTR